MDTDTMIYPEQLQISDHPMDEITSGRLSETELILGRVRLYARRRILWLQHLWRQEKSLSEPAGVTHAVIQSILDNSDNLDDEEYFYRQQSDAAAVNAGIRQINAELNADGSFRINQLQSAFSLSEFEKDLIQVCYVGVVDSQFHRLFAYLNDHSGQMYVSRTLTEKLFGYQPGESISGMGKSLQWKIISFHDQHSGEPAACELDEAITSWLSRSSVPDVRIDELMIPVKSRDPLETWPVAEALHFFRQSDLSQAGRLVISGAAGAGRKTFAKHIIEQSGSRMLCVNTVIPGQEAEDIILRVRRAALLQNKTVAWYQPDKSLLPVLNKNHAQMPEVIITETAHETPEAGNIPEKVVTLPGLSIARRAQLWRQIFPAISTWDTPEFSSLTTRYDVTVGEMHQAAEAEPQNLDEMTRVLNQRNHRKLKKLAEHLPSRFRWEDLIVADHVHRILDSIYYEAKERNAFWEEPALQRLFPQGRGLLALFTGPPGTGKTMAAQVLANRLHLDLYRIDLSKVVSKYVGESSKNLEEVIREAQQLNVILFFDEADALFGKRTEISDAHDRFANTDTGFLLQAIESYDGIAILASNKKSNIDQAFIRRLRFSVEFQKPDQELRLQIWNKILSELLSEENYNQLKSGVHQLSYRLELTGAQIKYAVLSALFLARKENRAITIQHLCTGIERELMKNGQGLTARQKEMILQNDQSN